ncbi:hypothetical protein HC031_12465 [Planosporangium thailandense]|uniref:Uncharacterized protein n=1 Tax=Planosporangium thailandense TaxID=765197 RepID=A0ABX0XZC7_9ACTN|nr:hypothetical protein [Planosporangium thailandense]NJC70519.1 hypothetical protein [Planosporangium thailandense]
MNRNQIRAVLHGARAALPYLTGRVYNEARDAIENLFAVLERRAPQVRDAAANYVALMELRSEVRAAMESGGLTPPIPVRAVLAERAVVCTLRAVAHDSWDDAADADRYLRRLAPDLMFELTVDMGPASPAAFTGRWLVEPPPPAARREGQPETYCGVAQLGHGRVLVYLADLDDRLPGWLAEFDDLAAAAEILPAHVTRYAAAAIVREHNRQEWLRRFARAPERADRPRPDRSRPVLAGRTG